MAASDDQSASFDELWDYDQAAETERRFREALAQQPSVSAISVELLTQIARAQGLQRRFDAAHATLDQAAALLRDEWPRATVRYLLERGRVFNSSGAPTQAQPLFLEAWQRASAADDAFYAVDAAHMLAIVAPPDEQIAWNLKALAHAERAADPRARRWLGSLYNNIGWSCHDQGQYEIALDYFSKALTWRQAAGQEREITIAQWAVARALRSLGRVEHALTMQQSLLADYERAGEQDGYVYEEIAECALLLGQDEQAQRFFALAHGILAQDSWLVAREPERLERIKRLAGL